MSKLSGIDRLILRIKKADTPVMRSIKRSLHTLFNPTVPPLPRFLRRVTRPLYELHFLVVVVFRAVVTIFYRNPLFQSRCATFGRNVTVVGKMPFVSGPVQIFVGDNVYIGGNVSVMSGGFGQEPKLILKDNCSVGWNVIITVNREVVIEENARIPHDCRISDSDGHPRQADLRRADKPPDLKDVRPVRICRDAWIGNGSHIMKGVTIGEGAIIGANSVVITDIPPFSLALGNPAEVYFKNYGRPSNAAKTSAAPKMETTFADKPVEPSASNV
jgi:acetyltransferase-like isoleucine patch superfamily enzyme